MKTAICLAALLVCQDGAVTLKHGAKGDRVPVLVDSKIGLKLEGSEALLNIMRTGMAFFSFQELRIVGDGTRKTSTTARGIDHHIEMSAAQAKGKYDDEPFEFDFDIHAPPADLEKKKLKQTCWAFAMGPRNFLLTSAGEYRDKDMNQDATQEAINMVMLSPVRLAEKPVKVGEEWTATWRSRGRQKDNLGRFLFDQKAKIEKIEEKGKRKCARIRCDIKGVLEIPEEGKKPNEKKNETVFEMTATILLDLDGGAVVSSDAKGVLRASLVFADPNTSDEHAINVEIKLEGKIAERE